MKKKLKSLWPVMSRALFASSVFFIGWKIGKSQQSQTRRSKESCEGKKECCATCSQTASLQFASESSLGSKSHSAEEASQQSIRASAKETSSQAINEWFQTRMTNMQNPMPNKEPDSNSQSLLGSPLQDSLEKTEIQRMLLRSSCQIYPRVFCVWRKAPQELWPDQPEPDSEPWKARIVRWFHS